MGGKKNSSKNKKSEKPLKKTIARDSNMEVEAGFNFNMVRKNCRKTCQVAIHPILASHHCCQAQKWSAYEKFLHRSCRILSLTHPHKPILFHADKSWDEWVVVWPFPLCTVIGWLGSKKDLKKGNNVALPGIWDCQGAEKLICELPPCRSLGLCALSVS